MNLPGMLVSLAAVAFIASACGRREMSREDRQELGKTLYERYCASCHASVPGEAAPVAPALRRQPPDLTRLTERLGRPLAREDLASFIDGRREVAAHGTREMPVWGRRLYEDYPQTPGTDVVREGTIALILDYLETIQVE